jgi:hypothetical protein
MGFLRQLGDDLAIKRHAALMSANLGQQSVIEPFAPTEPATSEIESYARHKNQVQLV